VVAAYSDDAMRSVCHLSSDGTRASLLVAYGSDTPSRDTQDDV